MRVAILIDGGFFLKRFHHVYRDIDKHNPKSVVDAMYNMAAAHLYRREKSNNKTKMTNYVRDGDLHRILFYGEC